MGLLFSVCKLRRPYPLDEERRWRVLTELARCGMTITNLARAIGSNQSNVSNVINGRLLQRSLEERIAAYLHVSREYLFPERTVAEILELKKKEEARKGGAT